MGTTVVPACSPGTRLNVRRRTLLARPDRSTATWRLLVRAALDPTDIITAAGAGGLILPAVGGAALTLAKFAAYSQMEVVRTGMLSRHVKAGGARVLQLGGTTRDLFYYPIGTTQVTVAGPAISVSLWEQAGIQAGVPVRAVQSSAGDRGKLPFVAGGSVDSVVAFDQLGTAPAMAALLDEVWRVLVPGGTFVFIQRVRGGPVAALVRLGGPPAAEPDIVEAVGNSQQWDFLQCDLAAAVLDAHAVGVAVKPLQAGREDFSVDKTAFEQLMKSKGKGGGTPGRKGFKAR